MSLILIQVNRQSLELGTILGTVFIEGIDHRHCPGAFQMLRNTRRSKRERGMWGHTLNYKFLVLFKLKPLNLLVSRVRTPDLYDTQYSYDARGRLTLVSTDTRQHKYGD